MYNYIVLDQGRKTCSGVAINKIMIIEIYEKKTRPRSVTSKATTLGLFCSSNRMRSKEVTKMLWRDHNVMFRINVT